MLFDCLCSIINLVIIKILRNVNCEIAKPRSAIFKWQIPSCPVIGEYFTWTEFQLHAIITFFEFLYAILKQLVNNGWLLLYLGQPPYFPIREILFASQNLGATWPAATRVLVPVRSERRAKSRGTRWQTQSQNLIWQNRVNEFLHDLVHYKPRYV